MRVVIGRITCWSLVVRGARLLMLIALFSISIARPVVAADPPPYTIAGEWEITFEVVGGKSKAIWIGRVWEWIDGVETITAHKRVDISASCESFGGALFGDDHLVLDGVDDYVTCRIPNFQQYFDKMTSGRLANCRCRFDGPPYAAANVIPVYSTDPQPVVFHNRLFLEVMNMDTKNVRFPFIRTMGSPMRGPTAREIRTDANNNLGFARLTLQFHDDTVQSWQSNLFSSWQADGFQIWAGYNATRYVQVNQTSEGVPFQFAQFLVKNGFWDAVQPDYVEGFYMWESEAEPLYDENPMPAGFGLGPGTLIYFGHNPNTDEFFEGTIYAASVDPGCRGH